MKKLLFVIALVLSLVTPAFATFYKISGVSRVDYNLYYSRLERIVIETSVCVELAVLDDVIYEDSRNIVIFPSGTKCDVKRIYQR